MQNIAMQGVSRGSARFYIDLILNRTRHDIILRPCGLMAKRLTTNQEIPGSTPGKVSPLSRITFLGGFIFAHSP